MIFRRMKDSSTRLLDPDVEQQPIHLLDHRFACVELCLTGTADFGVTVQGSPENKMLDITICINKHSKD